jgi:hypothetical protein
MADSIHDAQQEQQQEDAVVEAVAAALDVEASSSESEDEDASQSNAEDSDDAPMASALSQDPLSEGEEEQRAGDRDGNGDVASIDQGGAAPAVSLKHSKLKRIYPQSHREDPSYCITSVPLRDLCIDATAVRQAPWYADPCCWCMCRRLTDKTCIMIRLLCLYTGSQWTIGLRRLQAGGQQVL